MEGSQKRLLTEPEGYHLLQQYDMSVPEHFLAHSSPVKTHRAP